MNIIGRVVTLRAIETSDLPLLQQWANDPEIQLLLGGWHLPSSKSSIDKWYEGIKADALNQRFAIDTLEHGLIGTANLVDINWKDRNAFHGMMIGHSEIRGRGYGTDTVMAIMRYAFEELGLERLDGSIIEYNEASYRLYVLKCAWKEEGRKIRWYWRHNRFWDKIIVGINREDYLRLTQENKYWS